MKKIRSTMLNGLNESRKRQHELFFLLQTFHPFNPEENRNSLIKTGLLTCVSSYSRPFPYQITLYTENSGLSISSTHTVAGAVLVFHQIPF
jgi:hypothetical protein